MSEGTPARQTKKPCRDCGGMGVITHDIIVAGTEHDTVETLCERCKDTEGFEPDVAEPTPPSTGKLCRHCGEPEHITNDCHVSYTSAPKAPVSGEGTGTPETSWSLFLRHVTVCLHCQVRQDRLCLTGTKLMEAVESERLSSSPGEGTGTLTRKVTRLITETANGVGISRSIVGVWDVTSMTSERLAELRQRHEREFVYARDFDALAAEIQAKDAQLAALTAIKKQAKCLRLEHLIDGNDLAKRSETIHALQTYEAVAALQIENKKLESMLAEVRRQVEALEAEWQNDLDACRSEDVDPYTRGCADAIALRLDALASLKERLT